MARRSRSLSLPGRPSRFPLMEKNIALSKRKQVHWSTDLEEVIYFAPDSAIMRRDGSALRTFDRRVRMLRARSSSTLNKRLPLKASQTLARSINDANSMLIRTGVNILTHQFDRLKNRSDSLDMFDEQSNSRWKELLALYQKRMRDQLDEQEEEWVWGFEWVFGLHARSVLLVESWPKKARKHTGDDVSVSRCVGKRVFTTCMKLLQRIECMNRICGRRKITEEHKEEHKESKNNEQERFIC